VMMKRLGVLMLTMWFTTILMMAQDQQQVSVADLEALKSVSALALSPDGSRVAFCMGGAVWIGEVKDELKPTLIANGYEPAWSPEGTSLAYIAQPEGEEEFQLFRHSLQTGKSAQLTKVRGGVEPSKVSWSSNDRIVFAVPVPVGKTSSTTVIAPEPASAEKGTPMVLDQTSPDGYALQGIIHGAGPRAGGIPPFVTELFVYDVSTGTTKQLTNDKGGYESPTWSPNGRFVLAVSFGGHGTGTLRSALEVVDAEREVKNILIPDSEIRIVDPQWSPDGKKILYQFHSFTDPREHGVAILNIREGRAEGQPTVAVRGLVDVAVWSQDGTSILFSMAEDVTKPLIELTLARGAKRIIGSPEHVVRSSSVTVSRSGDIAWVESNGSAPSVVMVKRAGNKDPKKIFDANPELRQWALGRQEIVRWKSRMGYDRTGILIKPAGFRPDVKYPLIVSCYSQTTHLNSFQAFTHPGFGNQAFASAGYVVFFPGPRVPWTYGSLGKTESESNAIKGADGWDVTFDDVESGVDELIARGFIDEDRMAIVGHSNGGAVVSLLITRTNRYKAAVAIAPANVNWVQLELLRDDLKGRWIPAPTFTGIDKPLEEAPLEWMRGSIVFHMNKVQTPVLFAVGSLDHYSFTLPTAEMYLSLRRQRKEVQFLWYEGQGHALYGPAGEDLRQRVKEFLDDHLGIRRK